MQQQQPGFHGLTQDTSNSAQRARHLMSHVGSVKSSHEQLHTQTVDDTIWSSFRRADAICQTATDCCRWKSHSTDSCTSHATRRHSLQQLSARCACRGRSASPRFNPTVTLARGGTRLREHQNMTGHRAAAGQGRYACETKVSQACLLFQKVAVNVSLNLQGKVRAGGREARKERRQRGREAVPGTLGVRQTVAD